MAFVDIMQQIRAHDCDSRLNTHRFQPIQPGSEWVEKVDQLNQPKTVDPQ